MNENFHPRASFDFCSDWKDLVIEELSKLKLAYNANAGVEDLFLQLLQYQRRMIDQRRREILEANEFKCPPHLLSGYRILRRKIRKGKKLNSNLSKRVDNLSTRDLMLNDWGLYHFHLGTPSLSKENIYSGRTADLLFAVVTTDIFYAVGIWSHEFAKREIIETVRNNWPHLLHHAKLNDVVDLEYKNSDEELEILRKNGIMSMQMFDSNCYFAPGGGYSSTGDNLLDVGYLDKVLHQIKYLQSSAESIAAYFEDGCVSGEMADPLVLKLIRVEPGRGDILHPKSGRVLSLRR